MLNYHTFLGIYHSYFLFSVFYIYLYQRLLIKNCQPSFFWSHGTMYIILISRTPVPKIIIENKCFCILVHGGTSLRSLLRKSEHGKLPQRHQYIKYALSLILPRDLTLCQNCVSSSSSSVTHEVRMHMAP